MRTVAIIQARMGSTRLPGKVLLPLAGKSMLQNIVERVKRARLVDEVIIAPSKDSEDEIYNALSGQGFSFNAPNVPENDLIDRYYEVAKYNEADLIVRICSDNPLVEPGEIDRAIEYYLEHPRIFVSNMHNHKESFMLHGAQNRYPDGIGCEVFSWNTLQWMNEKLTPPSEYREHPHIVFHYLGMVESPPCPTEFSRTDLKLDVNTQAEYEYIKDIYDHFGHNEFHITEVIKYLDSKTSRS